MKKTFILLIVLTIFKISYGQNDNLFHSFKYGVFTEYNLSPTEITSTSVDDGTYYGSEPSTTYESTQIVSGSIANFLYAFRYNLLEPSENFSLGINASPSLGVSFAEGGFGSFNIPAYLTLNFGAGSTYNTGSNMGGYFGIGYEFTKINLVSTYNTPEYSESSGITHTYKDPITSWSEPMVIVGLRWWSKNDKLKEISFKYGFGSNGDLPLSESKNAASPATFQLTWGWFINY